MAPPGYPSKYQTRARELFEAGWGYKKIAELLGGEFDQEPSWLSVKRWVHPDFTEAERIARTKGTVVPLGQRRKLWRMVYDRMVELRQVVRLSHRGIADLLAHDFKVDISEEQVRQFIAGSVSEEQMQSVLTPPKVST